MSHSPEKLGINPYDQKLIDQARAYLRPEDLIDYLEIVERYNTKTLKMPDDLSKLNHYNTIAFRRSRGLEARIASAS